MYTTVIHGLLVFITISKITWSILVHTTSVHPLLFRLAISLVVAFEELLGYTKESGYIPGQYIHRVTDDERYRLVFPVKQPWAVAQCQIRRVCVCPLSPPIKSMASSLIVENASRKCDWSVLISTLFLFSHPSFLCIWWLFSLHDFANTFRTPYTTSSWVSHSIRSLRERLGLCMASAWL